MTTVSRTPAQAAASRANGSNSSGPVSEDGKATVSTNALGDGLYSIVPTVLPGESEEAMLARIEQGFSVFNPANTIEASLVVGIVYTQEKISRLDRLEHRRLLTRLEEELMKTPAFKSFSMTHRALTAVNALAAAVEQTPVVPDSIRRMDGFITGARGTLEILRDVDDLPLPVTESLESAIAAFEVNSQRRVAADAFVRIGQIAREVGQVLAKRLQVATSALEAQKVSIATDAMLLKDSDLKSIDRHRRMLETSMARQIGLLKAAKEQIQASKPPVNSDAKDYKLRLRVVK